MEETALNLCNDLYEKIPGDFDITEIIKKFAKDTSPLKVVLFQETERYNKLINKLRSSINLLKKGIKGEVVITPELEDIMSAIFENKVPTSWAFCFPSTKTLVKWFEDLKNRCDLFYNWSNSGQPPVVSWIGGFT